MNERDRPAEGAGHAQDARCRYGNLPRQPLDLRGSEFSGIPGRLEPVGAIRLMCLTVPSFRNLSMGSSRNGLNVKSIWVDRADC